MSHIPPIRRRSGPSQTPHARTLLTVLALAAWATRSAHACVLLLTTDCSLSGNPLKCHLLGVLNFLYAVAAVLAFVLIVVAGLAVKSYRRINRTKGRL